MFGDRDKRWQVLLVTDLFAVCPSAFGQQQSCHKTSPSLRGLYELEEQAVEVLLYSSFLDASPEPPWKSWRQDWDGRCELAWAWTSARKGTACFRAAVSRGGQCCCCNCGHTAYPCVRMPPLWCKNVCAFAPYYGVLKRACVLKTSRSGKINL